ncbi:MAG: metal ABC transporter substrate-binding protein [Pseudothermotoga sp.]|nr:metal ABC transporter substrate-binding protein [Pseudothermotoga sp.]
MRSLSTIFLFFCTFVFSTTVVVSIKPLELIVREIGGESCNVVCIMKNVNPHLYQLKTNDLKLLNEADLIVLVGFEEWAEKVRTVFPNKTLVFADGIFKKDFEHDEHLWLDPVNVIVFSYVLTTRLSRIDPKYRESFWSKWQNFSKNLLERIYLWYERLRPLENKTIVEAHPALTHFAKRFNLGEIFGLETGHEEGLTMKKITELASLVKKGEVKHIFVDEHVESSTILNLAKQLNLETIELDLMGYEVESYLNLIDSIVEKLLLISKPSK